MGPSPQWNWKCFQKRLRLFDHFSLCCPLLDKFWSISRKGPRKTMTSTIFFTFCGRNHKNTVRFPNLTSLLFIVKIYYLFFTISFYILRNTFLLAWFYRKDLSELSTAFSGFSGLFQAFLDLSSPFQALPDFSRSLQAFQGFLYFCW